MKISNDRRLPPVNVFHCAPRLGLRFTATAKIPGKLCSGKKLKSDTLGQVQIASEGLEKKATLRYCSTARQQRVDTAASAAPAGSRAIVHMAADPTRSELQTIWFGL